MRTEFQFLGAFGVPPTFAKTPQAAWLRWWCGLECGLNGVFNFDLLARQTA
jgi:hypothetical protein